MILLLFEIETETRARVTLQHFKYESLPEEIKNKGVIVSEIPKKTEQEGKDSILYINPQTKELWYEYEDRPLTPEEELAQVKSQLQATQQAVDFLLMGGM